MERIQELFRWFSWTAPAAEPERVTTHDDPEGEPVVARDGRVIFVRGRGAAARLWVRTAGGEEKRLTTGRAAERSPALSADGARIAYVAASPRSCA